MSLSTCVLFVVSDLRYLTYTCLSRGEIDAPLKFLVYLYKRRGLNENLLVFYLTTALESGQVLANALERLRKHIDFKSLQWVILSDTVSKFIRDKC